MIIQWSSNASATWPTSSSTERHEAIAGMLSGRSQRPLPDSTGPVTHSTGLSDSEWPREASRSNFWSNPKFNPKTRRHFWGPFWGPPRPVEWASGPTWGPPLMFHVEKRLSRPSQWNFVSPTSPQNSSNSELTRCKHRRRAQFTNYCTRAHDPSMVHITHFRKHRVSMYLCTNHLLLFGLTTYTSCYCISFELKTDFLKKKSQNWILVCWIASLVAVP